MSSTRRPQSDMEKALHHAQASNNGTSSSSSPSRPIAPSKHRYKATTQPFIGRLGGNQDFALDGTDSENASKIKSVPDAAPCMPLRDQMDLNGFRSPGLWKAAVLEGMGTMLLNFTTIYINISPAEPPPERPSPRFGTFNNATFIGPLVGGLTSWLLVTLFTYTFGALTGAHLNPAITMATFFARLCTLPRMILYVSFQTGSSALAGLLIRAAYGTRFFKTGGCWLVTSEVSVSSAFVIELMTCTTLLFLAFGVGLDPRQKAVIGPSLGPVLVGLTVGVLSFGIGFGRYGFGGASVNPARCFGAFVGSRFPGWHWINWCVFIPRRPTFVPAVTDTGKRR
ncbi:aquaporin-like protein [Amylocarpus encephaloides]|uniref:Aquaporin-like protein n=1 Tax=Amylocarpus encephaloides TaxID=45428 RepID=A0A9P7Y9G1_9HELO|nr:aquaporin-like protein [Amylocarpus encephaloides]